MQKIKICGIRRAADIEIVNKYRPDYIGFIFYKKSKRYISEADAMELRKRLLPEIKTVGVFVNEKPEIVAEYLNGGIIDIAQLHGTEPEEDILFIKKKTGRPVIKAVSVETQSDCEKYNESCADYILLDNGKGGTGKCFDWKLIGNVTKPFFLAGGINESNIDEAISISPYAVDVSGGVETDGFKDEDKIRKIINKCRKEL